MSEREPTFSSDSEQDKPKKPEWWDKDEEAKEAGSRVLGSDLFLSFLLDLHRTRPESKEKVKSWQGVKDIIRENQLYYLTPNDAIKELRLKSQGDNRPVIRDTIQFLEQQRTNNVFEIMRQHESLRSFYEKQSEENQRFWKKIPIWERSLDRSNRDVPIWERNRDDDNRDRQQYRGRSR